MVILIQCVRKLCLMHTKTSTSVYADKKQLIKGNV